MFEIHEKAKSVKHLATLMLLIQPGQWSGQPVQKYDPQGLSSGFWKI